MKPIAAVTTADIDRYENVISELLPAGSAINREAGSGWRRWMRGVGRCLAEAERMIETIAWEWSPLHTVCWLPQWLAATVTKDDCGNYADTIDENRARVLAKLRMVAGGMDGANGSAAAIAYLESVARAMGYEVTIEKIARCQLSVTILSFAGGVACSPRRYGEHYDTKGGVYGDCGYGLLACVYDKIIPARYLINYDWPF